MVKVSSDLCYVSVASWRGVVLGLGLTEDRVTSQNNLSPTSHIGLPLWRDCQEITDCSPLYETTREKNSQFSPRSKRYSQV